MARRFKRDFQLPFRDSSQQGPSVATFQTFQLPFRVRKFKLRHGSLRKSLSTPFSGFRCRLCDEHSSSSVFLSTPFSGFSLNRRRTTSLCTYLSTPFSGFPLVSPPERRVRLAFNSLFGILKHEEFRRKSWLVTALSTPFSGFLIVQSPDMNFANTTFNSLFGIPLWS